jgi:CRP/FNR family cyclic AMP-dependent transcriptional regulator
METKKAMDEMALLQQIPLFTDLPKDQLTSLAKMLERRTYRKGQVILRQGEPGESLFVIVSGQVRIYTLSTEGHEVSVSICDPGDFFGEMALLSGQPRSANVEAMQRTEVLVLYRPAFRQYLLSNPQTAVRLIEVLSERLRRTNESVEELASLSVPQRIARRLMDLAERYGVEQESGVLIDLDLSQEAMASLTGTTRESANRALSQLRDKGIVQIDRVRILITRPQELEKLAAGGGRCSTN